MKRNYGMADRFLDPESCDYFFVEGPARSVGLFRCFPGARTYTPICSEQRRRRNRPPGNDKIHGEKLLRCNIGSACCCSGMVGCTAYILATRWRCDRSSDLFTATPLKGLIF